MSYASKWQMQRNSTPPRNADRATHAAEQTTHPFHSAALDMYQMGIKGMDDYVRKFSIGVELARNAFRICHSLAYP
jgi:hypothetical protein